MRVVPALVVLVLVGTLSACGGTSPNYAGMSADEAASEALNAAMQDAKERTDPLHGRSLRLAAVVRGDDRGRDAWVVVLRLDRGERACVWIWADQRVIEVTYNYFVDTCTKKVLQTTPDRVVR